MHVMIRIQCKNTNKRNDNHIKDEYYNAFKYGDNTFPPKIDRVVEINNKSS
jgi:hypothetical protein